MSATLLPDCQPGRSTTRCNAAANCMESPSAYRLLADHFTSLETWSTTVVSVRVAGGELELKLAALSLASNATSTVTWCHSVVFFTSVNDAESMIAPRGTAIPVKRCPLTLTRWPFPVPTIELVSVVTKRPESKERASSFDTVTLRTNDICAADER